MDKEKKPRGIPFLAAFGILISIGPMIGIISSIFIPGISIFQTTDIQTNIEIFVGSLIALVFFIASIGLMIRKNWARITYFYTSITAGIITSIYFIILVYQLFFTEAGNTAGLAGLILPILIIPIIIWFIAARYLNKPEIKEYFNN